MAEWKHEFCGCCENCSDCLVGFLCPCVEAGLAADRAGQGTALAVLQCIFYPLLVPLMRYQARKDRDIEGNVVKDVAAGWCCPCCTSIQVKREFDDS